MTGLSVEKKEVRTEYIILALFLVGKIVLQFLVVHPVYDLHRDEFLHLDQGAHLAWGYQSVPPVTSWISWLISKFGNGIFWVKFFPALFGALTILVVWKMVKKLNGNLFACVLAALAVLMSVLVRLNILYQPNSLDVLCWTLLFYFIVRYIQTYSNRYLYFLAVSFAVGFLNKYNIAFCAVGIIVALALSEHRKIFRNPQFYFAGFLALLLISPNLLWQYQNDFPVLSHMKELAETQLVHVSRMSFVKEQFFFFIGSILLLIAAFISFFKYSAFRPYRFLLIAFVVIISLFIYLKAKGYYAIGLYPIYLAFGAVYFTGVTRKGWTRYVRILPIASMLFFFYMLIEVSMPIYNPERYFQFYEQKLPFSEHTWEDGKKHPVSQDFADMLGWKELAAKVDSVYDGLSDKNAVIIICDNYGQAGAINYYTRHKNLQADAYVPDYIKWIDLDRTITTMIRVKTLQNKNDNRAESIFKQASTIGSIENKYAREFGTEIQLLTEPTVNISETLKNIAR